MILKEALKKYIRRQVNWKGGSIKPGREVIRTVPPRTGFCYW